jgi:hypothetical protein
VATLLIPCVGAIVSVRWVPGDERRRPIEPFQSADRSLYQGAFWRARSLRTGGGSRAIHHNGSRVCPHGHRARSSGQRRSRRLGRKGWRLAIATRGHREPD